MTELEALAKDCIENHTHRLVGKPTKQDIYLREESIFIQGYRYAEMRISELEEKISILLSCKNCPENKGGYICEKEYENKCLTQKIQYIKELQEEIAELKCECRRCVYTDSPCVLSDYGKDRNGICDHFKDVFDVNAELKDEINTWKKASEDNSYGYVLNVGIERQTMFEKKAEEWCKENMDCVKTVSYLNHDCNYFSDEERCVAKSAFQNGAEFGYNKANEWHYPSKGELPKCDEKTQLIFYVTCYYGDITRKRTVLGYYQKSFMNDDVKLFVEKSKGYEDEHLPKDVIAWKEIVLPKESK